MNSPAAGVDNAAKDSALVGCAMNTSTTIGTAISSSGTTEATVTKTVKSPTTTNQVITAEMNRGSNEVLKNMNTRTETETVIVKTVPTESLSAGTLSPVNKTTATNVLSSTNMTMSVDATAFCIDSSADMSTQVVSNTPSLQVGIASSLDQPIPVQTTAKAHSMVKVKSPAELDTAMSANWVMADQRDMTATSALTTPTGAYGYHVFVHAHLKSLFK